MRSFFSFSTTPYCTRGGSKLVQPKVNTIGFGMNSFTYQGSKIWNNLPQGVKDTTYQIACKNLIVQWEGPTCKCDFVSCVMCQRYKRHYSCEWFFYGAFSHVIDICICILISVSGQAILSLAWNLIKWLFLLWVFIYVCTILIAVSCSFSF